MRNLILILMTLTLTTFANSNNLDGIKDYYISFALGGASNGYGSDYITSLEDNSMDRSSTFIDLGVYLPVDNHLLAGVSVTASTDVFDGGFGRYTDVEYTSSILGLSLIYFHSYVEEGWFYRGDLGLTSFSATYDDNDNGREEEQTNDEFGLGFLVGFGYAFPFNFGTITTSLLYSDKTINHSTHDSSLSISTLSFTIGGLF